MISQLQGTAPTPAQTQSLQELWRQRPRSRFLRVSLLLMALLVAAAWLSGSMDFGYTSFSLGKLQAFFVANRPHPMHGEDWQWSQLWLWFKDLMLDRGSTAALSTLSISVVAVTLAMLVAMLLALPAARNLGRAEPFLPEARQPSAWQVQSWRALVTLTRALLIFLRAIPEYVWAFLFFAMLGVSAWPAILALAIHNAGILGRLAAETAENTRPQTMAALRGLGARRRHIAIFGLLPLAFPRLLLYFFYRWETCVREATVLGMLGIASLGFIIDNARTAQRYDEMLLFIGLGAGIVMAGDLLSALARHLVRKS